MSTAKEYIYNLLSTDTTLTNMLATDVVSGEPLITQSWYDSEAKTPQITITRILETSGFDYDDIEELLVTPFQIDIWVDKNSSPTAIEKRVKELLKTVEIKSKAQDLHEESLNRVQIVFMVDNSVI